MPEPPWQIVREAFGSEPIVSQTLAGPLNIHVERYICEPLSSAIEPLSSVVLVTQFGGSQVGEGQKNHLHAKFFPNLSAIVPANCATEWQFSGFADFAVFYFEEQSNQNFCQLIEAHCRGLKQPVPITDLLVAVTSKQVVEELFQNKSGGDFVNRLMLVMLEKIWRILNNNMTTEIRPAYIHLGRIQNTVSYIQNNLDQRLSIEHLAEQVQLSTTHLRRLFSKATGMSIHQFITHLRMTKACELLINTEMPLIRIASALGFNSQSHFTSSFKNVHALTPARYRQLFRVENNDT